MTYLDLEIIIGDFLQESGITTAEKLEDISTGLHDHIDTALCDYARDEGIEDFVPTY